MTAPNDDRFDSFREEYRRFADAFQNAGVSVSDNFIAKIVNICPNTSDSFIAKIVDLYQSVSDALIVKIAARGYFASLERRVKEELRGQFENLQKRELSNLQKRALQNLLKHALQNWSLQESSNASPLSSSSPFRPQRTPPSQFERFAIERRRKPVASSKIKKPGLSLKRRPRVRRRTNGR